MCHWRLANGTITEILSFLDDRSRYALSVSAHDHISTSTVIALFRETADQHGYPASTRRGRLPRQIHSKESIIYKTTLSAGHYTATNTGPITRVNRADIATALVDQLKDTTYSRTAISVTN